MNITSSDHHYLRQSNEHINSNNEIDHSYEYFLGVGGVISYLLIVYSVL